MLNRRTIHEYNVAEVDIELVKQAIEVAIHAPNHRKTWPWYFVIGGDSVKTQIAKLSIELKEKKEKLSDIKKQALTTKFQRASYLVALGQRRSENPVQSKEDYATIACGVQNMSLFLWEKGIGTKWSSGGVTSHEKTYEIFNIEKEEYELVGFLWVGQPNRIPTNIERPDVKSFYKVID